MTVNRKNYIFWRISGKTEEQIVYVSRTTSIARAAPCVCCIVFTVEHRASKRVALSGRVVGRLL